MDFGFTAEQQRFRAEVRGQLLGPAVRAVLDQVRAEGLAEPDLHPLYQVLGDLGLLAVHWPAEYGGAGRTAAEAAIVAEELVRCGIPDTLHVNTIQIVGQFILMAGTGEQRRRHLPGLASGRRFASVLYTEPGAGSDLGSLSTVAEPDRDGYRITGTKVFSLKTRFAGLALCAARTGEAASKYEGISLFLIDLTAPGVHVSVIPSIADEQFHRVDLDGARVDSSARMGAEGEGWALLNSALAVERTGLDYYLKAERWLDAALDCLAGQDQSPDAGLLEQIGRYGADLRASHLLAWHALTRIMAGRADQTAAAVAKYHASELASNIASWASVLPAPHQRAAAGPGDWTAAGPGGWTAAGPGGWTAAGPGVLAAPDGAAAGDPVAGGAVAGDPATAVAVTGGAVESGPADCGAAGVLDRAYLEAPGLTLSAGTSEVMLQLVAAGFDTIAEEA